MLPEFNDTRIAFQYRSDKELKRAYWLFSLMASPVLTRIGLALTQAAIKWHMPVNGLIRNTIFRQFCGGETLEDAGLTAEMLGKYRVGVILDYGVEGKEDEKEYDRAVPEFIRAIRYARHREHIPFISLKVTGFARFALMEKVHAGQPLTEAEAAEWQRVRQRIFDICGAAAQNGVMVLIDAEDSWIQQPVDDMADDMMAAFNKDQPIVFNTFQLYRHDRLAFLEASADKARRNGYILGAKLVRGAYMEKERKRAAEMNYPDPIQPDKAACDRDYDAAVLFCLRRLENISLFIGTHNEESCLKAVAYMQEHHMPPAHERVYFSQLFGMSDNISFNLAHAGYNVAKYLPYGPVKDVIPYLMRRAQENTSVKGQTGRELSLISKEMKRRRSDEL